MVGFAIIVHIRKIGAMISWLIMFGRNAKQRKDYSIMQCQCENCRSACQKRPGWFAPGEAEKAAEFLGLTLQEFFDKYLTVDFWSDTKEDSVKHLYVLSPGIKNAPTGTEHPFDPTGECVFFDGYNCTIHEVKPNGCAFYDHLKDEEVCQENQKDNVIAPWQEEENHRQIVELLGREPKDYDHLETLLGTMELIYKITKDC